MQGFFLAVYVINIRHPTLQLAMGIMLKQVPLQAFIMPPLPPLAKLAAHEQKFLGGLRVHIGKQQPEIGKLLPKVARHFRQQ